jgi:hypothetical protein
VGYRDTDDFFVCDLHMDRVLANFVKFMFSIAVDLISKYFLPVMMLVLGKRSAGKCCKADGRDNGHETMDHVSSFLVWVLNRYCLGPVRNQPLDLSNYWAKWCSSGKSGIRRALIGAPPGGSVLVIGIGIVELVALSI